MAQGSEVANGGGGAPAGAAPTLSIVVEGYNESRQLGTVDDTLEALRLQDFPPREMEIVLVGSPAQADAWRRRFAGDACFHAVKAVGLEGASYYELKNRGAREATAPILAFTDSDVRPEPGWVRAIVEGIRGGADVVVGPSLFRWAAGPSPDSPLMRALASITWGWVMGAPGEDGLPRPRGFMDHNVALRADVFREHPYRVEFGRVIASPLLYRSLARSGLRMAICPGQRAAHHFSWRYWLVGLHFRYGYEVHRLRRLDAEYPGRWMARAWPLEGPLTLVWHVALDLLRWPRFARVLGAGPLHRAAALPLVLALSCVARGSEMMGVVATQLAPERMQRWARAV